MNGSIQQPEAPITVFGNDLRALLENNEKYPNLVMFSREVGVAAPILQKMIDGKKTGPSTVLTTVYLIAGRLNARVEIEVPTDDWNGKTPLSQLWNMGATIRLFPQ